MPLKEKIQKNTFLSFIVGVILKFQNHKAIQTVVKVGRNEDFSLDNSSS